MTRKSDLTPLPPPAWRPGHDIELLENGEAFYPRVFESIRAAQKEVLIETFILFEDPVGMALHAAVIEAARRGVHVEITVDGFGSPDLSPAFIKALSEAGVTLHIFDPRPKVLGVRTNMWRRLHRKLIVIDRARAFVGGINFSHDHLAESGPDAKQDYAVEVTGPVVEDIYLFMKSAIRGQPAPRTRRRLRKLPIPQDDTCSVMFVTRDNDNRPTDIEQQYRLAVRSAKHEVVIANAYFFPGFRMLRELRLAARRGVAVKLIMQGQPDTPMARWAPRMIYEYLLKVGVEIHEYCERPLHGKVAVVDSRWATVGSSNLDPLSLSFNLESNVFISDEKFNRHLRARLGVLMENHCRQYKLEHIERTTWQTVQSFIAFHFMRRFSYLVSWVPFHSPRLKTIPPSVPVGSSEAAPGVAPAASAAAESGTEEPHPCRRNMRTRGVTA
ncbi:MAG TPA: cardiolipin synthase ClsB [Rhodocyclaceae bacterium]|nr:cardiolipin synthase ClsB [Rhodocyclaceae bacterium]